MSRTSVSDLAAKADDDEPITMLTAYDAPTARLIDEEDVDVILVGDSAGDNQLGHEGTLPVTMEQALSNTAAVVRGSQNAMVVADMPFMSYGASIEESVRNAGRFLKEAGADAVKIETAPEGGITLDIVKRCTGLGIPVMGHVGLTPQRMNQMGGPAVQGWEGTDSETAARLTATACDLADAGAFAIVLEAVTEPVAKRITEAVDVPTIGIGAGRYVDGQVLVVNDMIGFAPSTFTFTERYADVDRVIREAVREYVQDVRTRAFPTAEHSYDPIEEDTEDDRHEHEHVQK